MLPRQPGDAVIPVVSARDATDEKVAALDLGADDFVARPFDTDELLARLRAALRHHGPARTAERVIRRGDLTIGLDRRLVWRDGTEPHLTRKTHDALAVLARHIGRVVTHDRVIAAAWGDRSWNRPPPVGSVIANELGVGYRLRGDS